MAGSVRHSWECCWKGYRKGRAGAPRSTERSAHRGQGEASMPIPPQPDQSPTTGRPQFDDVLAGLRCTLEPCGDVVFRQFTLGGPPPSRAVVVYCRTRADLNLVENQVLEPLLRDPASSGSTGQTASVQPDRLPLLTLIVVTDFDTLVRKVLEGDTALLVEAWDGPRVATSRKEEGRSVSGPSTEDVVRGPREAFVELLDTNLHLIRRRLPTDRLRLQEQRIGTLTRTQVVVLWIDGVADQGVVNEVKRRLSRIRIDGILDTAYLEELVEDSPYSPFPQVEHTERPDKVTAALLEGRVAVLTNGSPYALLLPGLLVHFLQSSEDYYERYLLSTALRWIRFLAFGLALLAPSFYVAVSSIHQEMIPVGLVLKLAATREGSPFPVFVEVLLMEVMFEVLREAGIRLPRPVGQAVSIVGGLVIGEASVRAGLTNPITIVVVAATGIASFMLPAYNMAVSLRLLRFPLLVITAVMGIPGLSVALMVLLTHLVALRSVGVPYLSPFAPARPGEWQDVLIRAPWWAFRRRPMTAHRSRRMSESLLPEPPSDE